jgi:hypothetical protein
MAKAFVYFDAQLRHFPAHSLLDERAHTVQFVGPPLHGRLQMRDKGNNAVAKVKTFHVL